MATRRPHQTTLSPLQTGLKRQDLSSFHALDNVVRIPSYSENSNILRLGKPNLVGINVVSHVSHPTPFVFQQRIQAMHMPGWQPVSPQPLPTGLAMFNILAQGLASQVVL